MIKKSFNTFVDDRNNSKAVLNWEYRRGQFVRPVQNYRGLKIIPAFKKNEFYKFVDEKNNIWQQVLVSQNR